MIQQLHNSEFMRQKVDLLGSLALEMRNDLPGTWPEDDFDKRSEEIRPEDVHELLADFEMLKSDETLRREPSDIWLPRLSSAGLLQSAMNLFYRKNGCVGPEDSRFGEALKEDALVRANIKQHKNMKGGKPRFLNNDPRWVVVLYQKWQHRRKGDAPFPNNTSKTTVLGPNARIVLLGDWGSGARDAIKMANMIRDKYSASHVIHLGDVYLAGRADEYRDNFLKHWPVLGIREPEKEPESAMAPFHAKEDTRLRDDSLLYPPEAEQRLSGAKQLTRRIKPNRSSWCLAGNHDMYSGGHDFFNMLKDERFRNQNESAYFLLENDHWQVFGLDTAFAARGWKGDFGELYGEQAVWMANKRAAAASKKCLLLTHHPPFSVYEDVPDRLKRQLGPILATGQIDAWFWGHEHRCAVFEPYANIRFPVLLGHGGFPERWKPAKRPEPTRKYEWTETDERKFLRFGFAFLEFQGPKIKVKLVDENNDSLYAFVID